MRLVRLWIIAIEFLVLLSGDITQSLVAKSITEQVFGAAVGEGTIWFGLIFWQKRSLLI